MKDKKISFTVDGSIIEAERGQTIIQACDAAGIFIPRLCHHPDLKPAGHCRICTCNINGHLGSACTTPVDDGMVVENETKDLLNDRRMLVEMLFVEGNHFCPSCEKSGNCELQALAYWLGLAVPTLPYLWPKREIDASHPDILIDHNRCVLCSRCIRASSFIDNKSVFAFEGRGIGIKLSTGGKKLDKTSMDLADKAASICPVGCIIIKRIGYQTPYGSRYYDEASIDHQIVSSRQVWSKKHKKRHQTQNS